MDIQKKVSSYEEFVRNIGPKEIKILARKMNEEIDWFSITPNSRFFNALRKRGIEIGSEEEMNTLWNLVNQRLKGMNLSDPMIPYTTKVVEYENLSLKELGMREGEIMAFDHEYDPDCPTPLYIILPKKIVYGRNEGGIKIIFQQRSLEQECWTFYTDTPVVGLWSSNADLYDPSRFSAIVAGFAYSGRDAILDAILGDPDLKSHYQSISKGKLKNPKSLVYQSGYEPTKKEQGNLTKMLRMLKE